MTTLANQEIRETARRKGVRLWRVAEALCITDAHFSRKLRHELPADERARVLNVIDQLAGERREVS